MGRSSKKAARTSSDDDTDPELAAKHSRMAPLHRVTKKKGSSDFIIYHDAKPRSEVKTLKPDVANLCVLDNGYAEWDRRDKKVGTHLIVKALCNDFDKPYVLSAGDRGLHTNVAGRCSTSMSLGWQSKPRSEPRSWRHAGRSSCR